MASAANATIPVNEPATIAPPSSVGTTALTTVAPAAAGDGCDPIGTPQSTRPGGTPASGGGPMSTSPASLPTPASGGGGNADSPGSGRALHASAAMTQAARAPVSRRSRARIPQGYPRAEDPGC